MNDKNKSEIKKIIETLGITENLKKELRHSWLSNGRQESVAEHCYQMSLMALMMSSHLEKKINLEKVLKMIIAHDLPEAVSGDIPFFEVSSRKENKQIMEEEAMATISKTMPQEIFEELNSLWQEFEENQTLEAKFVKAIDNLEVQIQHNFADFSTWQPIEYLLVYTKMDKHCAHDSFLKDFCDSVKLQSEKKLIENGIDVEELKSRI